MVVNSESDFGHRIEMIEPTIISDHEITSDCMICLFDFIIFYLILTDTIDRRMPEPWSCTSRRSFLLDPQQVGSPGLEERARLELNKRILDATDNRCNTTGMAGDGKTLHILERSQRDLNLHRHT